jgi:low temperature requirement protein LtrA
MMISSRSAFLHLPMVAGIVIFAIGVKTTLAHVHAHLHSVAAVALAAELPSTFSH